MVHALDPNLPLPLTTSLTLFNAFEHLLSTAKVYQLVNSLVPSRGKSFKSFLS